MNEADRVFLAAGLREHGGFGLAAEWYVGQAPMPKQYAFHQATQPNVIWVGSIASGKTWGIAASGLVDCITLPRFKLLSTSITSSQAEIPFDMVHSWLTDDVYRKRTSHLVSNIRRRPYPTIEFTNGSVWLFRTAGYQATHIRGLEFDRIIFDEAGYEYDVETMHALRGRLRGERMPGIPRMARLDAATSPTDSHWLRQWFDRGDPTTLEPNLENYVSIRSTIWDNTHITRRQIELMMSGYTDEMVRVELGGQFPDYGATLFAQRHILAAEDRRINDEMEMAIRPESGEPKPGYDEEVHPRHGIVSFELPADPRRRYIMAGDPGSGDYPKRNAGVVLVFDVTEFPSRLVYFKWTSGQGSYRPFLEAFKYAAEKYQPHLKGIDATGPQSALDELGFTDYGIETDRILFNREKNTALNALSMALTGQSMKFPFIKGLHMQLSKYKRDDKNTDNDIVMALAMVAYLARYNQPGKTSGGKKRPLKRQRNARGRRTR